MYMCIYMYVHLYLYMSVWMQVPRLQMAMCVCDDIVTSKHY